MKQLHIFKSARISVFTAVLLSLSVCSGTAAVDLVAMKGNWTSGDGAVIPMWGFMNNTPGNTVCPTLPGTWTVAPELDQSNLEGNDLVINLLNCLDEEVSIIIPGLKAEYSAPVRNANGRIKSFAKTVPANGGTETFRWPGAGTSPGSYIYMSGNHPARQVPMGLYGAVKLGTYENTAGDLTLFYSEIDRELNIAIDGAPGDRGATPLEYKPDYYLLNGDEGYTGSVDAGIINGNGQPTVLSFMNAGLDFFVPTLQSGYMDIVGEDGNSYPITAKQQYSVNLAAGKTMDAFWQPATSNDHVIFDRRGNAPVAAITVGPGGGGASTAVDDSYSVDEDTVLTVDIAGNGVLANDTVDPTGSAAILVAPTTAGSLTCPGGGTLCADGTFVYSPNPANPDFNGVDTFTYKIDPNSNTATVTITVNPINDAPVGVADNYSVDSGQALDIPAPGVLANDINVDGDTLTVQSPLPDGIAADGALFIASPVNGQELTYVVCDDSDPSSCSAAATVTITVNPVDNIPPIAVDDVASTSRNTDATIPVTDNDIDDDGQIDVNSVALPSNNTSRGGNVIVDAVNNGSVIYSPKRGFKGTDTFTYTVQDVQGATSAPATVRVNVLR